MHRPTAPSVFPDDPPLTRADWIVLGVAIVLPTLITWLYFVALEGPAAAAAGAIGKTVQFALPVIWVWLVQRQSQKWTRPQLPGLAMGLAFGLAVLAAMTALYWLWLEPAGVFNAAAVQVRAKVGLFGVKSLGSYVMLAVFYSLVHSLLEEYYWRWFVFRKLVACGTTLPWAIAVSSIGFSAHHVLVLGKYFGYASPWTWLFTAGVGIGGAVWAWIYVRSQSLAGPWLSHAVIDATIFLIGWEMLRPT